MITASITEVYSVPRTAWNFLTLCERGYYDNTKFHRLVPGFVVQGGDPTGSGSGGESAFGGESFADEFDSRLIHDKRGILSMANSGSNTNGSQFFIIFKAAPHLNLKHGVFGHVVGGLATLDAIERVGNRGTDKRVDENPSQDISIMSVEIFSSPLQECEAILEQEVRGRIQQRTAELMKKQSIVQPAQDPQVAMPPTGVKRSAAEALGGDVSRVDLPREDRVQKFMATEGDRAKSDEISLLRMSGKTLPASHLSSKQYGNFSNF